MKIGFIGLGVMGRPMAGHLIDAGHTLTLNRVKPASQDARRQGRHRRRHAEGGRRGGRRHHPDGPRHARRRGGALRRGRRRRGPLARQARHRHELDLAGRHQGVREADRGLGLRLPRRPGLRRRGRRQERRAHDHGRRQARGLREGEAALRDDGQDHHPRRPERRRPDRQGREPDHRRPDHPGRRRGADLRQARRRRSRPRSARRWPAASPARASSRSTASGWSSAPSTPASASACTARTWASPSTPPARSNLRCPNAAIVEQLMNAAIARGDGDRDHSGLILTLEALAGE